MAAYKDLTKEELLELKSGLQAQFEEVKARGLKLDMSRGKPAAAQLNLSGRYDGSTKRQRNRIRKFQSECDV